MISDSPSAAGYVFTESGSFWGHRDWLQKGPVSAYGDESAAPEGSRPSPFALRLTDCHCPGGGWIMGAAASESFGCAEEGLSYRGSLVEHGSSGGCAAEQSGIEHGAEVAAYGAERHAGRCHELGCGGRGVKNKQQMSP